MDDATKLKTAVGLIITGLYEQERSKVEGEYCYSKWLMHGINQFQSLNYKYNRKQFDFNKLHEQCFIQEYAMKPPVQWFEGWESTEGLSAIGINGKSVWCKIDKRCGCTAVQTIRIRESIVDGPAVFASKQRGNPNRAACCTAVRFKLCERLVCISYKCRCELYC